MVRGLESGLEDLEARVPLSVGIPISPMLGSITRSIDEVFARLGSLPFTAETKLDGQRLQMHVRTDGPQGEDDGGGRWVEGEGGRVWVRLFSRHLEDMTEKVSSLPSCLPADNSIRTFALLLSPLFPVCWGVRRLRSPVQHLPPPTLLPTFSKPSKSHL
jgi:hypothetical protein